MKFKKGHTPWNKGLKTGSQTPEHIEKCRLSKIGHMTSQITKDKISRSLLGHEVTQQTIELIKKNKKTHAKHWLGKKLSETHRVNLSKSHMGKKQSSETIKKRLTRRPLSSLEIKTIKIFEKLNLPYKFVGNGEFFIENKCPDFINVNGEKIAVEVFWKEHKDKFNGGYNKWRDEREKLFNSYGWKLEFFDETQVNELEIKRRLM